MRRGHNTHPRIRDLQTRSRNELQQKKKSETAMAAKRLRKKDDAVNQNVRLDRERPLVSRTATMASKIAKRPLIVALIDQGNPLGQIIQEK